MLKIGQMGNLPQPIEHLRIKAKGGPMPPDLFACSKCLRPGLYSPASTARPLQPGFLAQPFGLG
ncbi:MAG: hypothetical protein JW986_05555 [Methanotrichaceae archaeon]|nr:hypothetical protein [Methanotrichaceae archaeon]